MNLKKEFRQKAILGFFVGAFVGVMITVYTTTFSYNDGVVHYCVSEFVDLIGNELTAFTLEVLLSGIYGIVGIGGCVVYRIESWSALKAFSVHFSTTVLSYLVVGFILHWWSPSNPMDFLIMLLIFAVCYLLIWGWNYFFMRKRIERINEQLTKKQDPGTSDDLSDRINK